MIKKLFQKGKSSGESLKSRKNELIVQINPKSPVTEAFRNIRTNLSFISSDKPLKTVAVTSSVVSEGKSFVLANMAVSMINSGKRVVVIDADMRKPIIHRFFELTNTNGLSNILFGKIDFAEGLKETDIDGLSVITAGTIPPNPAELLASHKMEEVLKMACNEADIVFIDTPPVIVVTDGVIISNKVDGTILVVTSYQTEQKSLVKAKEVLDKARAHIVGVIINKYPYHYNGGKWLKKYLKV